MARFGFWGKGCYIIAIMKKDNRDMKDFRSEIMYWQNRLNKAINCAPCDYSEKNIKRALSSLNFFVNRQVEVDFIK